MAWPVIAFKLLFLKFLKGAVLGLVRYLHRVFSGHQQEKSNQVSFFENIKKHAFKKENLIYLILMLGNIIYGLQELFIIVWGYIVRKRSEEYFTGLPSAFELPHDFCQRVAHLPWSAIWKEVFKWFFIAGLFHWPGRNNRKLSAKVSSKKYWIEVRWQHRLYMIKTHSPRTVMLDDLNIVDYGDGKMQITTNNTNDVPVISTSFDWE